MSDGRNWLDLNLSKENDEFVRKYAAIYKASYLDTIDNVFGIAKSLEIVRDANYATGMQGSYNQALIQYGFTNRDGEAMDKSLRSNFKDLLDNEDKVRAWWKSVPEKKKRFWLSGRAIYRNWQASTKPKQPAQPKTAAWSSRQMPSEPFVEGWARGKPSDETLEAKQAREAEAEAAELEAELEPEGAVSKPPPEPTCAFCERTEKEGALLVVNNRRDTCICFSCAQTVLTTCVEAEGETGLLTVLTWLVEHATTRLNDDTAAQMVKITPRIDEIDVLGLAKSLKDFATTWKRLKAKKGKIAAK